MNASNHGVTLVTNFTPEIGITRQMNCILSLQWLSVVLFQLKMASFKSTAMNQSNLSYGKSRDSDYKWCDLIWQSYRFVMPDVMKALVVW